MIQADRALATTIPLGGLALRLLLLARLRAHRTRRWRVKREGGGAPLDSLAVVVPVFGG